MNKLLLSFFILFVHAHLIIAQDDLQKHQKTDLNILHDFIDSLVQDEMIKAHVPGAVVVIVQDSQDLFINGYGFADVENEIRVDPKLTGFRIASVTKTFTATAILQLAQQGLIDLHAPISNYLPDENFTFLKDEPFTVHQLLTHTAGIDLTDIGDAAVKPEDVVPIEEFVRGHIPDVVNPPGMVHSYSNFGYTILGYLIQEISGMPYEEYIKENILQPLDMRTSSISQPLEEPFKSNLAKGYEWDGAQVYLPRDYTNTVPGGGMIATASDMSKYLLMHLNNGKLDSTVIINTEFHDMLTAQQYGSKNTKYGICYSFFENGWTGRRSIDHTGGQLGFLSLFLMIPETGTGIFIAHNSRENANAFRYDVTRAILDTLLNKKERHIGLPKPSEELDAIANNYVGLYQQMNYSHSSFEKLGQLFGFFNAKYVVSHENDGMLTLSGDKFVMVEKELFHRNDETNPWNVEFELDEKGSAQRIIAGTTSYKKTSWYESNKVWQILFAGSLLMILFNWLKFPVHKLYKKIRKQEISISTSGPIKKWLNWTAGLLIIGMIGLLVNLSIYQGQLADYGVPLSFKIPLVLNTLGALMALYSPVALYKVWHSKLKNSTKVWDSFCVLAIIILAIGYWHFNIIGFQF